MRKHRWRFLLQRYTLEIYIYPYTHTCIPTKRTIPNKYKQTPSNLPLLPSNPLLTPLPTSSSPQWKDRDGRGLHYDNEGRAKVMPGTKDVHLALDALQNDCGLLPAHPTVSKFRALSQQMSLETVSACIKDEINRAIVPP